MAGERQRELLRIELEQIEREIDERMTHTNPEDLVADDGDLPQIQDVVMTDFQQDLEDYREQGREIIDNLADLYLDNNEQLIEHPYIRNKRGKDAENYAHLNFLVNSSEKSLISIMKAIELGESTPRMYEVLSMLQKEMRENLKLSSTTLSSIEGFYKNIRDDLGIAASANPDHQESAAVDMRSLNEKLDQVIKSREKEG